MQPYPGPYGPPPPPDNSKKFMHTGVGILTIVLAVLIGLPTLCCGGLFFMSMIGAAASSATP